MEKEFSNAAEARLAVWLMRHGSNSKESADATGETLPLSDQGRREGQAMAEFLAGKIDYPVLILTSDFARNIETGEIVGNALMPKGEVARYSVPAIRSEDIAEVASIYGMLQQLDAPEMYKQLDLSSAPRTVILVGNKRNMFLEHSRVVIDLKGELTRISAHGEGFAEMDADAIRTMAEDSDRSKFDAMVGEDSDMELFEEGRLVGYDLGTSHWQDFPDPDKVRLIVDRSFSETGKKWTLHMEAQRLAARNAQP
ncbi:MAG TPA: phosphoglycerate mutase family protein [Patescibacteria group bacterium]|nr:phosphoglycerate mutase family protein [Patescibacteria group bacterium]